MAVRHEIITWIEPRVYVAKVFVYEPGPPLEEKPPIILGKHWQLHEVVVAPRNSSGRIGCPHCYCPRFLVSDGFSDVVMTCVECSHRWLTTRRPQAEFAFHGHAKDYNEVRAAARYVRRSLGLRILGRDE